MGLWLVYCWRGISSMIGRAMGEPVPISSFRRTPESRALNGQAAMNPGISPIQRGRRGGFGGPRWLLTSSLDSGVRRNDVRALVGKMELAVTRRSGFRPPYQGTGHGSPEWGYRAGMAVRERGWRRRVLSRSRFHVHCDCLARIRPRTGVEQPMPRHWSRARLEYRRNQWQIR